MTDDAATALRPRRARPPAGPAPSRFFEIRRRSEAIAAPLAPEDCAAQSMPDASPVKWHLAHTTWFFETFVLARFAAGYRPFDARYAALFNSYYQAVGRPYVRSQRGLLTRPALAEVRRWREHVDEAVAELLDCGCEDDCGALVELGLQHEQQHQELMLTDLKHLFSCNPLLPAYRAPLPADAPPAAPMRFVPHAGGVVSIGAGSTGFSFDNERPRHAVLLQPFGLADRLVTNAEYRSFIDDGGYREPRLWLADGWDLLQREGWTRPLYWQPELDAEFTLAGVRALVPSEPVCHLSFFEADAFARWAGARLPAEAEWESAAAAQPPAGHFVESERLHPRAETGPLFGNLWQWTASAYLGYPGFRPAPGAVAEYNGKFMNGQWVLRGGSCASPASHLRASYRNFFPPQARWQFSGLRLARDL